MKQFCQLVIINCIIFILVGALDAGDTVACSRDQKTCAGCAQGLPDQAPNLFTYQSTSGECFVTDCSQSFVGSYLNGWICSSCQSLGDLNIQGPFFDGTQCVQKCPDGQYANDIIGNKCQVAAPGQQVSCSIDQTSCNQCGFDHNTYNQFSFNSKTKLCSIKDCKANAVNYLNGWVCNSCSTATGDGNIPKGQYYDGKSCVNSCPNGQSASLATQFVCSPPPNPGNEVGCSADTSTCKGCGQRIDYLRLFTYKSGNYCSVIDCNSTLMTPFLNGFVCNSCSQAPGTGNIPKGQYFYGNTCVTDCPSGYSASAQTQYICQKNPQPVPCSQDSSTCVGCGDTTAIQQLFTYAKENTCTIIDCSTQVIGTNLNGYVCQSCSVAYGKSNIPKGQYYDGSQCVQSCDSGYAANKGTKFICQRSQPGQPVNCKGDSSNCLGCGQTSDIQNLFAINKQACQVIDCSSTFIGSNLNGWVCNSCYNVKGPGITIQGQYFDGTNCVTSCPIGSTASESTGFACLYPPSPGSAVACSSDSSTCGGCGKSNILQKLFTHGNGNNCSVTDCNQMIVGSNLNGWVCNSCSQASGDHNIAKGQYYNGSTCVSSCPPGQYANAATGYVCQIPNPGTPVTCSNDSSTCGGCGSTAAIQSLFTHGTGNNCSISDCTASVIGSNLNGWVCNSCSTATGNGNITTGQYFNGTTCLANCPPGQQASASTGYVCQPIPNNGSDVSCSKDSSTCGGCGLTSDIQKLFTHGVQNKCSVNDCSTAVVGSNLNGWVCNSCSTSTGKSNIAAGQYYDGKTCVSSCPNGQSASEASGFECKANSGPAPVNNNASQSSLIGYALIFTILKILV